MTKKDYIIIANSLAQTMSEQGFNLANPIAKSIVDDLVENMKLDNHKFDSAKFKSFIIHRHARFMDLKFGKSL